MVIFTAHCGITSSAPVNHCCPPPVALVLQPLIYNCAAIITGQQQQTV